MRGARRGSLLLIKSDLIITASPRGAASISGGDAGAGAQKRPRQPADFRLPRGAIPSLRAISEEAGSRPPGCRCSGKSVFENLRRTRRARPGTRLPGKPLASPPKVPGGACGASGRWGAGAPPLRRPPRPGKGTQALAPPLGLSHGRLEELGGACSWVAEHGETPTRHPRPPQTQVLARPGQGVKVSGEFRPDAASATLAEATRAARGPATASRLWGVGGASAAGGRGCSPGVRVQPRPGPPETCRPPTADQAASAPRPRARETPRGRPARVSTASGSASSLGSEPREPAARRVPSDGWRVPWQLGSRSPEAGRRGSRARPRSRGTPCRTAARTRTRPVAGRAALSPDVRLPGGLLPKATRGSPGCCERNRRNPAGPRPSRGRGQGAGRARAWPLEGDQSLEDAATTFGGPRKEGPTNPRL